MGINPTQSNFKSFTFDGVNSRQYGVYITGGGVFDAPERNVEMVEIPGRNGAYALDRGNFNNIEVTYPASIATYNETEFAEAVSDLRSFLCSRVGYVRLEDDYNPDEYRLAIYKSGLEVSHDMLIAGEFDIVFECKPQRFLKSGEDPITIGEYSDPVGTDNAPYLFRRSPQFADTYDTCIPTIVGGSVGWNQLVESTGSGLSVTVPNGHKYYSVISGTKTIGASTGTAITGLSGGVDMVIDLTAKCTAPIADRAYAKEQAQAGSGIAWLKSYGFISDSYEAYDTGTMQSVEATEHVTTGKNVLKSTVVSGQTSNGLTYIVNADKSISLSGTPTSNAFITLSEPFHLPSGRYCMKKSGNANIQMLLRFETAAGATKINATTNDATSVIDDGTYVGVIRVASGTNTDGITLYPQLELGSTATEYEPYTSHTYPLGNVTLRGIPKLDGDSIYYDGDLYHADGTVDRNYVEIDLGSLNWTRITSGVETPYFRADITNAYYNANAQYYICSKFYPIASIGATGSAEGMFLDGTGKLRIRDTAYTDATAFTTAMDGVKFTYKRANPTTETTDPFTSPMLCDPSGTEEWVTDNGVPVGQVTEYGPDPTKLHNPTLFASKPQLQVWGYGDINLGDETVSVENVVIGNTPVSNPYTSSIQYLSASYPQKTFGGSDNALDVSMLETGDAITLDGYSFTLFGSTLGGATISQLTVTPTNCSASVSRPSSSQYQIKVTPNAVTINKGTSVSDTELCRIVVAWSLGNGTTGTTTVIFEYRYTHTSSDDLVYWVVGYTGSIIVNGGRIDMNMHADSFIGDSTKPITGNPLYIDLDIGEAWNEDSGTPVAMNYGVTIPAELPTLSPGGTEITYDNTVTQLKVVPRWWKV